MSRSDKEYMFPYNMVLIMDVLQYLYHNIWYIITVCCEDGGIILFVTKAGLTRCGVCLVSKVFF